jgi:hypothetical protein
MILCSYFNTQYERCAGSHVVVCLLLCFDDLILVTAVLLVLNAVAQVQPQFKVVCVQTGVLTLLNYIRVSVYAAAYCYYREKQYALPAALRLCLQFSIQHLLRYCYVLLVVTLLQYWHFVVACCSSQAMVLLVLHTTPLSCTA